MRRLLLIVLLLPTLGMAMDVDELVEQLQLEPHVEGGYFKRTFEASHRPKIDTGLGPRFTMTSIFYLLTEESRIGHWHMNQSDIIHFFHLGDPITYYLLHPDGKLEVVVMGPDPSAGHQLQLAVPGGVWKASNLQQGDYGLISEAVAPGFEFEDMSLGKTAELLQQFPQHAELLQRLSRD